MFEFSSTPGSLPAKRIAAYAAVGVLGGALGGYAIHEHHTAQTLTAKNQQTTAALDETKHELVDLASKVNMLVARSETPAPTPASSVAATKPARPAAGRPRREDPHFKKLQSQIDAQGKALDETRSDLANTRTELTGSIAHTHDELVLLQKRGERNYTEFDVAKSKQFAHKGPFGVRLKKANVKHQYADLELIVDDRNLSQKHVNLYQPVMFYTPDSPQPVEVVINDISKDHIHGYISAPKYHQSELASMASVQNPDQAAANPSEPPAPRKKLPVPQ